MESAKENKKLKRILICMDWYEPGFKAGGPIRSVVNIINALKDEFEFYVLTSAFDLGETEPYENIEADQWFDKDGVIIKYMSKANMKPSAIKANILEINPDLLYLNSLFSRLYTLAPLSLISKIPVVIAPRGMLGEGALEIKRFKKLIFLRMAKWMRFYKRVIWHASTVKEEAEIKAVFGSNAEVVIARNIPTTKQLKFEDISKERNTGEVRFVFISRISRKKNLHLAVHALRSIKADRPVKFDIYGNIEDEDYYKKFRSYIQSYGNVTIAYHGALNPSLLPQTFLYADYFILPTKHENFGHAIVESWANGCPVILSQNTPWRDLKEKKLGWDVDLKNPAELVDAVQEAADMPPEQYLEMVKACFQYFQNEICDDAVIEANRKLFQDAG